MSGSLRLVFFDLGDTLGVPQLSRQGRLAGFKVFDFAAPVLEELKSQGLRLGIISNTGDDDGTAVDRVLKAAKILDYFEVRVYSRDVALKKDSPDIFVQAAALANLEPRECVFVGEDSTERTFAVSAGMRACPHPLLASEVVADETLQFVRLTVPAQHAAGNWRALLRGEPLVPLHASGPNGTTIYAMTSVRTVPKLVNYGLGVELLGAPGLPQRADLYLMRDDAARTSGFMSPGGEAARFFQPGSRAQLVATGSEGLVVAIPQGGSPDDFHFAQARHGHTLKLLPQPRLLSPMRGLTARSARVAPRAAFSSTLTPAQTEQLGQITAAKIRERVNRYSGQDAGANVIASRHAKHPDNARAVSAIEEELEAVGNGRITVRLKRFTHVGFTLHNVEGELAGESPEVVLVTAHLDSTAGPGSNPSSDPAPGADDDASGVAAVLTIAECLAALYATPPPRTVRFVLFNAEEQGLIGSQLYARELRDSDTAVAAVFQMDMIGYNRQPPRSWEVHAGFPASESVEAASVELGELIQRMTPLVSPELEVPQIYRSTSPSGDPGAGRSDHAAFQAQGYAACCASEDLFVGPDHESPEPEGNPDYHLPTDHFVDEVFAADIARVVAAAALMTIEESA